MARTPTSKENMNPEILKRMETPASEQKHFDIAARVRERIEREGIPKRWLAKSLGIYQSNFTAELNGRIPIPMDVLERLLWILDGEE